MAVRKVATQEGVQYYGLPLGTPITAQARANAKARNGGKPEPSGATVQSKQGAPKGQGAKATPAVPTKIGQNAAAEARRPGNQFRVNGKPVAPTGSKPAKGTQYPTVRTLDELREAEYTAPKVGENDMVVTVAGVELVIPKDSRAFTSMTGRPAVYAVDSKGRLHFVTKNGNLSLTKDEQQRVMSLMVEERENLQEVYSPDDPQDAIPAKKSNLFSKMFSKNSKEPKVLNEHAEAEARRASGVDTMSRLGYSTLYDPESGIEEITREDGTVEYKHHKDIKPEEDFRAISEANMAALYDSTERLGYRTEFDPRTGIETYIYPDGTKKFKAYKADPEAVVAPKRKKASDVPETTAKPETKRTPPSAKTDLDSDQVRAIEDPITADQLARSTSRSAVDLDPDEENEDLDFGSPRPTAKPEAGAPKSISLDDLGADPHLGAQAWSGDTTAVDGKDWTLSEASDIVPDQNVWTSADGETKTQAELLGIEKLYQNAKTAPPNLPKNQPRFNPTEQELSALTPELAQEYADLSAKGPSPELAQLQERMRKSLYGSLSTLQPLRPQSKSKRFKYDPKTGKGTGREVVSTRTEFETRTGQKVTFDISRERGNGEQVVVEARIGPRRIGKLRVSGKGSSPRHTQEVEVSEQFQRQGIATGMLDAARQMTERPIHHSGQQTPEGLAWAKRERARGGVTYGVGHGQNPDGSFKPLRERNPNSRGDEIKLADDPGDLAAAQKSPFTAKHLTADGDFTPERKALHDAIIDKFLDGIAPVDNPTQYMNGGGPASGKGSMTRGLNAKITNYPASRSVNTLTGEWEDDTEPQALKIDPDEMKVQFPEAVQALERLQAGVGTEEDVAWAANVHTESSYVAARLHKAAIDRGLNIIFDGTGNGSANSVRKKVAAAREMGYKVVANYLYLDPEVGIQRAAKRAEGSHRVVPEEIIRNTYGNIPGIFDEIKEGLFDDLNLFDNNTDGQPAERIGHMEDGVFVVDDQTKYENFLRSNTRAHLSPTASKEAAQKASQRAKKIEPEVTAMMERFSAQHGLEMWGQDFKFKDEASAARKIAMDASAQKITPEEAGLNLSDALRYTMTSDGPSEYVRQLSAVLKEFRARGFRTRIKNRWATQNDNYRGVNVTLTHPNGSKFELQFHTIESMEVRNFVQKVYEEYRVTVNPERRAALHEMMADMWDSVDTPDDIWDNESLMSDIESVPVARRRPQTEDERMRAIYQSMDATEQRYRNDDAF